MTHDELRALTQGALERGIIDEDGKRWFDNLPMTTLQGLGLILPGAPVTSTLIVRRFAPVLSQMDARLLQQARSPHPVLLLSIWVPRAKKLVKYGLLAQEVRTSLFTITEAGTTVLERFYNLGWLERPRATPTETNKEGTKP